MSSQIDWSNAGRDRVLLGDNAEDTPKLANRFGNAEFSCIEFVLFA